MDCKTAWTLFPYAKSHAPELDVAEGLALRQHLENCAICAPMASYDQAFDESVGKAMRDVPIPDGLRERLVLRLASERHGRQRSWLLYATMAAAATIILSVGVYQWSWKPNLGMP